MRTYREFSEMGEIRAYHEQFEGRFFSAENRRAFKARPVKKAIYHGEHHSHKNLFVTYEEQHHSNGDISAGYTVRQLSADGEIHTLSAFMGYKDLTSARAAAKRFANEGIPIRP